MLCREPGKHPGHARRRRTAGPADASAGDHDRRPAADLGDRPAGGRGTAGRPRGRSSEPETGVAGGERQRVPGQPGHPAHRPGPVSHLALRRAAAPVPLTGGTAEAACCSAAHILWACSGSTRVSLVEHGEQHRRVRRAPARRGGTASSRAASRAARGPTPCRTRRSTSAPRPNRSYRTMSSSGAEQMTAAYRSGRCVSAAPTSRPPFDPPEMASCPGVVQPSRDQRTRPRRGSRRRRSACEPSIPARCHSSPSSLPPRRLAIAYTPPADDPGEDVRRVGGGKRDVEPAVAVEDRRTRARRANRLSQS